MFTKINLTRSNLCRWIYLYISSHLSLLINIIHNPIYQTKMMTQYYFLTTNMVYKNKLSLLNRFKHICRHFLS